MAAPARPSPPGYGVRDRARLTGPLARVAGRQRRDGDTAGGLHRLAVAPRRRGERASRQPARPDGARVDADAIAAILRFLADRVPVNDYRSVRVRVGQERLADPPEIARLLGVKRHPGVDPCVNEQVVADPD